MRIANRIQVTANSTVHLPKGFKVLHAEWAEWGGGVELVVEQRTEAELAPVYLATMAPGMGLPDNAEYMATLINPFVLLYGVHEVKP